MTAPLRSSGSTLTSWWVVEVWAVEWVAVAPEAKTVVAAEAVG